MGYVPSRHRYLVMAAFGDFHEELVELIGSTTTYWCLKTMSKAGPDEHYVHRWICVEGRSCWESCEQEA